MPRIIAATAVVALTAGSITLAAQPGLAADIGGADGEAVVYLQQCAKGTSQTDTFVKDCSYSYLTKRLAPAYTYLTSQGYILWNKGELTNRSLTFPAGDQTWPKLTGLFGGASSTAKANEITGTVNADGTVELTLQYETFLDSSLGKCTLSGTVTLSSEAPESLGGGAGRKYDPETAQFAVASTAASQPQLTPAPGSSCAAINTAYDLTKGMGWYLSGYLVLPGGKTPVIPAPDSGGQDFKVQDAKVSTPKRIAKRGKTVLLKKSVRTNADQKANARLTWAKTKNAGGTAKRWATAKTTKSGKVTIRTTGKAKVLYVKLRVKAPAKGEYQAFEYTKMWKIR